jgi:hypothetical protein
MPHNGEIVHRSADGLTALVRVTDPDCYYFDRTVTVDLVDEVGYAP